MNLIKKGYIIVLLIFVTFVSGCSSNVFKDEAEMQNALETLWCLDTNEWITLKIYGDHVEINNLSEKSDLNYDRTEMNIIDWDNENGTIVTNDLSKFIFKENSINLMTNNKEYKFIKKEDFEKNRDFSEDVDNGPLKLKYNYKLDYGYDICEGEIQNNSDYYFELLKLKCYFLDSSNNVVNTDTTFVNSHYGFRTQESVEFKFSVKHNNDVAKCVVVAGYYY